MDYIESAKEKLFAAGRAVRTLSTPRQVQPDPSRLVTVNELPLYEDDVPRRELRFVEDEPLPLEREFATVRHAYNEQRELIAARFSLVDKFFTKVSSGVVKTANYVETEAWPRALAIVVGGMAGFVLGRTGARRVIYTTVGTATMAAFCYPHETVALVRGAVETYEEFKNPVPSKNPKNPLSPPK